VGDSWSVAAADCWVLWVLLAPWRAILGHARVAHPHRTARSASPILGASISSLRCGAGHVRYWFFTGAAKPQRASITRYGLQHSHCAYPQRQLTNPKQQPHAQNATQYGRRGCRRHGRHMKHHAHVPHKLLPIMKQQASNNPRGEPQAHGHFSQGPKNKRNGNEHHTKYG